MDGRQARRGARVTARDIRHRLEYAGVVVIRGLVRWLPDPAVRAVGQVIGSIWAAVDGRHRRLAVAQLRAALPSKSEADCRTIARATFSHFAELFVVLLKFSTLTAAEMRARVEFEGDERVRDALLLGKGVLLFSGHFGFWELQGMTHPLALPPMSVLARKLDNPYLQDLLENARRKTGNHVIYKKGAVRRVLRALEANECVAIMIDQHTHSADAVAVDFFNRPAATTSALAAMALRTGAPVIPVFALPLADGRFRMVYEHPVERPAPDAADPVRELTQRCTDVVEMYVRRNPQRWLWLHRRWRLAEGEPIGSGSRTSPATADEMDA
jgi:KDO2-lipid IV(A) lauroyltransferase